MDELVARIAELREQEELASIKPPLDGREVMEYLGVGPSAIVGKALAFLLEERLEHGPMATDEAHSRLAEWARAQGIERSTADADAAKLYAQAPAASTPSSAVARKHSARPARPRNVA